MKISAFGREITIFEASIPKSGLENPEQWLVDGLSGGSTYSGVTVNEQTAMRLSAVWACVKILSESIASLPLILYRRDGDTKVRATEHPLYGILHDRPNSEMTAFNFKSVIEAWGCLRGNGYAEIETDRLGRTVALWPIPLDQFAVTPERFEGAIRYRVRDFQGGREQLIPLERMFHLRGLGFNGLVGLSPIQQARQAIGIGLAAEEYGARFFGDGANLGGVLEHPGKLSKEAGDRLKAQWEAKYAGIKKSHKTAVLEEGMKFTPIGLPPGDAQFIETRKFQVGDIARIYRVPPHMLGDLDRATWANIEQQSIDFVVNTLGPWFVNWEQEISAKLLTPVERKSYYVEFLVDALLRGDVTARNTSYTAGRNGGWLSANDIRRRENMDPIEGGDVYLVPLNMVPADQAGTRQATNAGRRAGDGQG